MPGSVHRSERYVVVVEHHGLHRKLLQIQFSKTDGSIFINFPYYRFTVGVVSLVQWPGGLPSANLSLEHGGSVTSHLVKYSHHPDGRAHFSQDGRVRTVIKKMAVPLANVEGHLFTVHAQGLDEFECAKPADTAVTMSRKRTVIRFLFGDERPNAIKFVGRLYQYTSLEQRAVNGMVNPTVQLESPDGKISQGFVCSSPTGFPCESQCLVISCEAIPVLDQARTSLLTFVGGFDSAAAMNDANQPVSFLALSYPADDAEVLRTRLGSIDYVGSA
jgi:hypothetical protein